MVSKNIPSLRRRKMMAALILGVAAGVIASIAERVDTILTGGNATPLGYINTYTWLMVSAALFGPVGAIITTEIQAFIGLITAANPLSWLWPLVNLIFALGIGLVYTVSSKLHLRVSIQLVSMSITCALLDIPMVYLVIVTVLGLPFIVYLGVLPIYIALQLIPSTFLSYILVKAILRSKILNKQSV